MKGFFQKISCTPLIRGKMGSMEEEGQNSEELEGQVVTRELTKVKRPSMYVVILLNDDYTPMDFVVWILESVFHKPKEEAVRLMLDVHQKGQGRCGVYPYDIARTKVFQVKTMATKHEHPLECIMEEEGSD